MPIIIGAAVGGLALLAVIATIAIKKRKNAKRQNGKSATPTAAATAAATWMGDFENPIYMQSPAVTSPRAAAQDEGGYDEVAFGYFGGEGGTGAVQLGSDEPVEMEA